MRKCPRTRRILLKWSKITIRRVSIAGDLRSSAALAWRTSLALFLTSIFSLYAFRRSSQYHVPYLPSSLTEFPAMEDTHDQDPAGTGDTGSSVDPSTAQPSDPRRVPKKRTKTGCLSMSRIAKHNSLLTISSMSQASHQVWRGEANMQ